MGSIDIEDSYGVETLHIGDYQVRLDGRTDAVHKEALYVAEQVGIINDHGLDDQDLNDARQSIRDDGNFSTDYGDLEEAGEIPEEAREEIREKLQAYGYLETGNDEQHTQEKPLQEETEDDIVYTLADGSLEILADQTYQVPVNDEPTLEALGALAGVFSYDRIRHEDEDTGSMLVNEKHYNAIQSLKEAGLVTGTDARGFEVEIEIPDDLKEDMREHVRNRDHHYNDENIYEATVDKLFKGDVIVNYEEGIAKVPEYDGWAEPGDEIKIREAGQKDGMTRAEIID